MKTSFNRGVLYGLAAAARTLMQLAANSELSESQRRAALYAWAEKASLVVATTKGDVVLPDVEKFAVRVDEHGAVQLADQEPASRQFVHVAALLREETARLRERRSANEPPRTVVVASEAVPGEGMPLTWAALVSQEPSLGELHNEARAVRDIGTRSFCANRLWSSSFKPRVERLVGWECRHPDRRLKTGKAYDVALQKIYHALPNCRNCACF